MLAAGNERVVVTLERVPVKVVVGNCSQTATEISHTANVYFSNRPTRRGEAERRISSQGAESFESLTDQTYDTAVAHACCIDYLWGEDVGFLKRNQLTSGRIAGQLNP